MKSFKQRSACPISSSLDVLGDKWTLLILRDILFKGKSTYGEFLQSAEKMATNILADRLVNLEAHGMLTKVVAPGKKSKFTYHLTEKGIATLPILVELVLWGAQHFSTDIDVGLLEEFRTGKGVAIEKYKRLARETLA
ncbi:transcriptional regulator [Hymenobacter sediminis]|uniref:winged helix-turn-helix transcriptional regulator n=1 Tax=Hymenobacter sediminis TaxID=2218621 RepID=UPI000DA6CC92|nr:helix-turn-helix domain-containing protein [Hymenobacter sediminis]RPD43676.1 transcriptional regulator [Hymenobacter sediminis]